MNDFIPDHPLVDIEKARELSLEQIDKKILELNKKLHFSYKTSNERMMGQINMALKIYQKVYDEKIKERYGDGTGNDDYNINIDIS